MSVHHHHGDHAHADDAQHNHHDHSHGAIDPSIATSSRGLWAVKWSCIGLLITALLQAVVVFVSGSVALFADTIHNFSDAATAIPLGIAFTFAKLKPTKQFSYGYGKVEDLAGIALILIILSSAIVAGYEAIHRLFHPQVVTHIGAIVVASIIGFLGNEIVAMFRIKVGKEINSAALIADGYHARTDGWTSLAVLVGAAGVYAGFPLADPLIGLGITIAILFIVWESIQSILVRVLDGVEPDILEEIEHAVTHVVGVCDVSDVRARWIGHKLHIEMNVAVEPSLTVQQGHDIAKQVQYELKNHIPHMSFAMIHIDPSHQSGEKFHPC